MADSLEGGEVDLLESALSNSTAFSSTSLPRQSVVQPPAQASSQIETVTEPSGETERPVSDDSWKQEYESHVHSWRAQSAEAREKAEKERARWEAIREAESKKGVVHNADHGWETVDQSRPHSPLRAGITSQDSSSPADSRELVPGEAGHPDIISQVPVSVEDSKLSSSQKWEEVSSEVASSFPSISFPDHSDAPSPFTHDNSAPKREQDHPKTTPTPSATLAIFDSSLSTRSRVSALFSSLAINMFLPFVNGVMLGFGEIFAKNVIIGWLGWKVPRTPSVANVGVGLPLPKRKANPGRQI